MFKYLIFCQRYIKSVVICLILENTVKQSKFTERRIKCQNNINGICYVLMKYEGMVQKISETAYLKIRPYAVRNVKMEHYAVRKGNGVSPLLFVKGMHHN